MVDHPSTYRAKATHRDGIDWDDRAALHRVDDGDGLFDDAKALQRGTFAELIQEMMAMPEEERRKYLIQKSGDRKFHANEVADLAEQMRNARS